MNVDMSTINQAELRRYPVYKVPPSYSVSSHLGAGCAGDAPGYPSYFLQSVYTASGNTPRKGPDYVIQDEAGNYRRMPDWWSNDGHDKRKQVLDRLYLPLPIEHPRVRTWILHTYQHFAHCYGDPARGDKQRHVDGCVIWPVPYYKMPLDPRKTTYGYSPRLGFADLSEDTQANLLAVYRASVKATLQQAWNVAKNPANHLAVLAIRKFYPEYEPEPELIAHPPSLVQADWWERYAEIPAESECPGHLGTPHGKYDLCRLCGREDSKAIEVRVKVGEPSPAQRYRALKLYRSDFDYQVDGWQDANRYSA